jgi:hypothetical protein
MEKKEAGNTKFAISGGVQKVSHNLGFSDILLRAKKKK